MFTVWSRAAQTRASCRCPQCIQTVHGVSRRATASATRRMPRYFTSSTLFYSGIFAAAATFDAGVKKQRREQWDRAIAEVKQELGQAAETVGQQQRHGHEDAQLEKLGDEPTLLVQRHDIFEDVEPHRRKPQWPTNTGPELKIHRLPPESIYSTEERKARAELRRWTPKKLETVMLSVDLLQLQIFLDMQASSEHKWREEASSAVPTAYRDKMFLSNVELREAMHDKLSQLRAVHEADPFLEGWARSHSDIPLCNYQQDDQGYFHDTARELTGCLQGLFRQHKEAAISTPALLAKLAYNLSISPAPPNVHTYNTLLLGLSDAKQDATVRNVIRSLRRTHMRPNEITNVAVLSHLTATDNAAGFIQWVELMRGKHRGLQLARPNIRINEAGDSRLIRVKREGKEDKIIQLPYPTPNVFSALIKGVLKFSGFETALNICEGMGHEGWGLCMSGLTPLLMDCADRGDWDSGLAVWRQIQALKSRSLKRYAKNEWAAEQIGLETFAAMIRLCSACGQKSVFQDVWELAMKSHLQAARSLVQLVKAQKEDFSRAAAAQAKVATAFEGAEGEESLADRSEVDAVVDRNSNLDPEEWMKRSRPENSYPTSDSADHVQLNPADAGSVLRELRSGISRMTLRESTQSPPQQHLMIEPESDEAVSKSQSRQQTRMLPRQQQQWPPQQSELLLREQLDGWLPPSHELDDYEMRERPMTMYG